MFPEKKKEKRKRKNKPKIKGIQRNRKIKQATETACENNQMSDLTEKYLKKVIMNMFTEVKKSMIKEIEENMLAILH